MTIDNPFAFIGKTVDDEVSREDRCTNSPGFGGLVPCNLEIHRGKGRAQSSC